VITLRRHDPFDQEHWLAAAPVATTLTVLATLAFAVSLGVPGDSSWLSSRTSPVEEPVPDERITYIEATPAPLEPSTSTPPVIDRPVPATAPRAAPMAPPRIAAPVAERPVPGRTAPDSIAAPTSLVPPRVVPSALPPITAPAASGRGGTAGAASSCAPPCAAAARVGVGAPGSTGETLTAAERDSILRAIAASVPAKAAGGVEKQGVKGGMGGVSIPIGLPGGGPSAKQRARDRATFAENLEIMARLKARADSVAAARKRDSTAAARRDSTRRPDPSGFRDRH
jgi:hypothetical protein